MAKKRTPEQERLKKQRQRARRKEEQIAAQNEKNKTGGFMEYKKNKELVKDLEARDRSQMNTTNSRVDASLNEIPNAKSLIKAYKSNTEMAEVGDVKDTKPTQSVKTLGSYGDDFTMTGELKGVKTNGTGKSVFSNMTDTERKEVSEWNKTVHNQLKAESDAQVTASANEHHFDEAQVPMKSKSGYIVDSNHKPHAYPIMSSQGQAQLRGEYVGGAITRPKHEFNTQVSENYKGIKPTGEGKKGIRTNAEQKELEYYLNNITAPIEGKEPPGQMVAANTIGPKHYSRVGAENVFNLRNVSSTKPTTQIKEDNSTTTFGANRIQHTTHPSVTKEGFVPAHLRKSGPVNVSPINIAADTSIMKTGIGRMMARNVPTTTRSYANQPTPKAEPWGSKAGEVARRQLGSSVGSTLNHFNELPRISDTSFKSLTKD